MIREEDFKFSKHEIELLYWSQYWSLKKETESGNNLSLIPSLLRSTDSNIRKEKEITKLKKQWLLKWSENTQNLLEIKDKFTFDDIKEEFATQKFSSSKIKAFTVEFSTFIPYFPLSKNEKLYNNIKFNSDIYLNCMGKIIPQYGNKLNKCRKLFLTAQNTLAKEVIGSNKILTWVSLAAIVSILIAPYLGTVIGGVMGLHGAAAMNTGLAFLGFGSISAGGLGIAGGTIAVMTGGSLIAYKSGDSIYKNQVREQSGEALLISCAKLSAVTCLSNAPKETVEYFCSSSRSIQFDFEKETDELFIVNKVTLGKDAEKKAKILGAFRKFIRTLY